jgi:hypothetical protein
MLVDEKASASSNHNSHDTRLAKFGEDALSDFDGVGSQSLPASPARMARKLLLPLSTNRNRNQLYFMEDRSETPESGEDRSSLASFCLAAIPFLALTIGPLI